jgi:hypothetical protein
MKEGELLMKKKCQPRWAFIVEVACDVAADELMAVLPVLGLGAMTLNPNTRDFID